MTETSTASDGWAARQLAQAAGFNAIGSRYDEVFPHKEGQLHLGEVLVSRLPPGARVLDVGCGTGLPTAGRLAEAGFDVVGIDISPVMLELARSNVPKATFLARDAVSVDAGLGTFDAVVAFFSLLMLPRDEVVRTLGRIRGILRPGGLLAIAMVEADLDDAELPFLGASVRLTGWPREQWRRVLESAGFTVEVEDARSYLPPVPEVPPEVQLFCLARRE